MATYIAVKYMTSLTHVCAWCPNDNYSDYVGDSSTKDDVFYEDVVLFIAIVVLFDMNSSDLVKCLA